MILKLVDFDRKNELSLLLSDSVAPTDKIVVDVAVISDSVKERGQKASKLLYYNEVTHIIW